MEVRRSMKNFLLIVLDYAVRLVLWGLSLAAIVIAGALAFNHQLVGALLAFIAFGALGGLSGYRQLSGAWIGWNRYQTRPEDELAGLASGEHLGLSNDVLDETPFRDD
jgi:hypothetical protein